MHKRALFTGVRILSLELDETAAPAAADQDAAQRVVALWTCRAASRMERALARPRWRVS